MNAEDSGTRGPIGSVAEEAAKLFAMLQEPGTAGSQEGVHKAGPECQWCPICQLVSRVRTTRPETVEHLATAAAGVLGSLRSLLDAAAEAAREHAKQPEADSKEGETRVDRIDVSEDPEPWD